MPPAKRKRPLYLVMALLGAIALGSMGTCSGWTYVTLYRASIEPTVIGQRIEDDADRALVVSRFEALLHALDAAKSRGWPLVVATLILGGAILTMAMRTIRGSRTARAILVQLILAQAGTSVLRYWLLKDVIEADLRLNAAMQMAAVHEAKFDAPSAEQWSKGLSRAVRLAAPIDLGLNTVCSLLIVLALTRRRTRELLDSANTPVGEP